MNKQQGFSRSKSDITPNSSPKTTISRCPERCRDVKFYVSTNQPLGKQRFGSTIRQQYPKSLKISFVIASAMQWSEAITTARLCDCFIPLRFIRNDNLYFGKLAKFGYSTIYQHYTYQGDENRRMGN